MTVLLFVGLGLGIAGGFWLHGILVSPVLDDYERMLRAEAFRELHARARPTPTQETSE